MAPWMGPLFKSDAPYKQVAAGYKKDYLTRHIPAKATDWICVKGNPVLNAS